MYVKQFAYMNSRCPTTMPGACLLGSFVNIIENLLPGEVQNEPFAGLLI